MYNMIYGAIALTELEFGPCENWIFDDDEQATQFYQEHIRTKMQCIKTTDTECYLADGSMIRLHNMRAYGLMEHSLFPFANEKSLSYDASKTQHRRYRFSLNIWLSTASADYRWGITQPKTEVTSMNKPANKITRDKLLNGPGDGTAPGQYCKGNDGAASCFQLIKRDGWVIKDDYPW